MGFRSIEHLRGATVTLIDSVTQVLPEDAGKIVVTGSHGGASAAGFASKISAKLYVFNDAGIGKNEAGTSGLILLEQEDIAAVAVAHISAEIGSASDSYQNGVVSALNEPARLLGLRKGEKLLPQLDQLLS